MDFFEDDVRGKVRNAVEELNLKFVEGAGNSLPGSFNGFGFIDGIGIGELGLAGRTSVSIGDGGRTSSQKIRLDTYY